jgi:hypothetical protein
MPSRNHDDGRFAIARRDLASRAAAAAMLLAIGCAGDAERSEQAAKLSSPLYGGTVVGASAWPNVVQLDDSCTGVLLAPSLVVFSAHCGPFVAVARANGQEVATKRCAVYPKGMPGGTDMAYCVLEHGFEGVELVGPALGCEVDAIVEGAPITLVGYGYGEEQGSFGTLRVATSQVMAVSSEVMVRSEVVGTCAGDSGGPAFIEVPDSGGSSLRLVGVLSGSESTTCEAGPSYYTPLWPFVGWLEAESGVDISPCGTADGTWSPTSTCLSASRLTERREPAVYSASCGPPFDEAQSGERPAPTATCHVAHARGSHTAWLQIIAALAVLAGLKARRSDSGQRQPRSLRARATRRPSQRRD